VGWICVKTLPLLATPFGCCWRKGGMGVRCGRHRSHATMRQECNQLPQMFLPLFVFLYLPHNFYSYFSRFTSAPSARLLLLRPIYAATAASTSAQCAAAASAPAAACSAAAASIDYHRQLRCHQRTVVLNEAARQAPRSSLGHLRRSLAALSSMTNRALFLMVVGCCPR
jgi:hypothetical protein